ncbi:unnamed protein product [Porites lobata]|uniref:Uncharacterized protein n=1 Tax=Porites lobata TaxID=104759 RepID=A0ABN8R076_9CNID|nr:unnamed protein product [Porites lobata]
MLDQAQHRLYRRLWALLCFGSGKKLGAVVGCQHTYVYPPSLKKVAREIISGDQLVDTPDPTHVGVFKVNIG